MRRVVFLPSKEDGSNLRQHVLVGLLLCLIRRVPRLELENAKDCLRLCVKDA